MKNWKTFHNFINGPDKVGPFSHAVEADGWVQLTGQMPTDPKNSDEILTKGIEAQTRRVMDNLIIVLNELELDLSDVTSCRVYLTEFSRDYEQMNSIYKSYFLDEQLPARTCIGVTGLARQALIEIDMIAKRPIRIPEG